MVWKEEYIIHVNLNVNVVFSFLSHTLSSLFIIIFLINK